MRVQLLAGFLLCLSAASAQGPPPPAGKFAPFNVTGTYGRDINGTCVGNALCKDGEWMEFPGAVWNFQRNPDVQCFRTPPCIRWSWLNEEKCKRMKDDEDYPTADPHLKTSPDMKTIRDVFQDYLVNKTIMFVGDSINNLVYRAAQCELWRWGLTLVGVSTGGVAPQLSQDMQARLAAHWRLYSKLGHVHKATEDQFWVADPPAELFVVLETNTFLIPKGWHKYKRSDAAGFLALSDVVVVNYGLHYHAPSGQPPEAKYPIYEAAMGAMFDQLAAFASQPGKGALFRETSAQHFAGTGSYASDAQAHPKDAGPAGCKCHPMNEDVLGDNDISRMNAIVRKLSEKTPPVGILPFYNITAPRFDMHEAGYCGFEQKRGSPESNGDCCDCTHLCHTPQFWRHVFANLHTELGRTNARMPLPLRELPGA